MGLLACASVKSLSRARSASACDFRFSPYERKPLDSLTLLDLTLLNDVDAEPRGRHHGLHPAGETARARASARASPGAACVGHIREPTQVNLEQDLPHGMTTANE